MKYFIIIHIFGKLSQITRFFFQAATYYETETKFCVSVSKSICVQAHAQTKKRTSFEMWYRNTGEPF